MDYSVLKALHVAAVLIFVGGFVAQTLAVTSLGRGAGLFLEGVEWWDRRITTPAMLATWLLGVVVAVQGGHFASVWLILKLAIVVALSGLHGVQAGRLRRALAAGAKGTLPVRSRAPLLVMLGLVAIAILAVAKPF